MSDKVVEKEGKSVLEIEASSKDPNAPEDSDERVEGAFDFVVGEDLEEDIELFGAETIREMAHRAIVVKAQSAIRTELQSGTHPDDIPEALSGWRPDVTHTAKKDPRTSIVQNWKQMSEEERQALLDDLAEMAG